MTKRVRPIRIKGNTAYITLTMGYVAIIDAADVSLVKGCNWYAQVLAHTVYAGNTRLIDGERRAMRLHRLIMDPPDEMEVDHISCDGLDCRRANMRQATRSQNCYNQRIGSRNTSGYKGVSWNSQHEKWEANIYAERKRIFLGRFTALAAAHDAYCKASERLHGEYGRTR